MWKGPFCILKTVHSIARPCRIVPEFILERFGHRCLVEISFARNDNSRVLIQLCHRWIFSCPSRPYLIAAVYIVVAIPHLIGVIHFSIFDCRHPILTNMYYANMLICLRTVFDGGTRDDIHLFQNIRQSENNVLGHV